MVVTALPQWECLSADCTAAWLTWTSGYSRSRLILAGHALISIQILCTGPLVPLYQCSTIGLSILSLINIWACFHFEAITKNAAVDAHVQALGIQMLPSYEL